MTNHTNPFGLNTLHINPSAAHRQTAIDLLTLLELTSRLRQRIGPLEHDSLTRIAQQLCRELDIPYSLFQSITD